MDVHRVILDHMKFIDYYPAGYTSAEQYIQVTRMDKFGTWGTDTEMVNLAPMACHLHPILCTWDAVVTCTPVTVLFPLGVWKKRQWEGLARDGNKTNLWWMP